MFAKQSLLEISLKFFLSNCENPISCQFLKISFGKKLSKFAKDPVMSTLMLIWKLWWKWRLKRQYCLKDQRGFCDIWSFVDLPSLISFSPRRILNILNWTIPWDPPKQPSKSDKRQRNSNEIYHSPQLFVIFFQIWFGLKSVLHHFKKHNENSRWVEANFCKTVFFIFLVLMSDPQKCFQMELVTNAPLHCPHRNTNRKLFDSFSNKRHQKNWVQNYKKNEKIFFLCSTIMIW